MSIIDINRRVGYAEAELVWGSGGPGSLVIDLFDRQRHYILYGGLQVETADGGGKQITLHVRIVGNENDDVLDGRREIERVLRWGALAYDPESSFGDRLYFDYRWSGSAFKNRFVVVSGSFESVEYFPDELQADLVLQCQPMSRLDRIRLPESPTITAGLAGFYLLPEPIQGDGPAPAHLTIRDQSASDFIARVRVGVMSMPDLAAGDFMPFLNALLAGAATNSADTDAMGGGWARLAATTAFTDLAYADKPAGRYNVGSFDVWGRFRDASTPLATPGAPTITANDPGLVSSFDADAIQPPATSITVTTPAGTRTRYAVVRGPVPTSVSAGWTGITMIFPTTTTTYRIYATNSSTATFTANFAAASTAEAFVVSFDGDFQPIGSLADKVAASYGTTPSVGGSGSVRVGPTPTLEQAAEVAVAWAWAEIDKPTLAPRGEDPQPNDFSFVGSVAAAAGAGNGGIIVAVSTRDQTDGVSTTFGVSPDNAYVAAISTLCLTTTTLSTLKAGTYDAQVMALDESGGYSAAGPTDSITITLNQIVSASWSAVAGAYAYRLFITYGGLQYFIDLDPGQISYILTNLSDLQRGTPAVTARPTLGRAQMLVGTPGGTVFIPGRLAHLRMGQSSPEWLYLGNSSLPLVPRWEDGSRPDWRLKVQAMHPRGAINIDLDGLALFPHSGSQLVVEHPTLAPDQALRWEIDSAADRTVSAMLYNLADDAERGVARAGGPLFLPPGPVMLVFMLETVGGVAADSGSSLTFEVSYLPSYNNFGGGA
jgi:hypothetical protein